MRAMPAGRLRHRIRLEQKVIATDSDDGVISETWEDAFGALISADIAPLSGRELIASRAANSRVSTRIRIRWRPGVTADMRAVHRSTIYAIEAVVRDDQSGQRWLTLNCASGTNEG